MFGKYNGFVSKARVSACMYFLVSIRIIESAPAYSIYSDKNNTEKAVDWEGSTTRVKTLRLMQY
jgi:hypothetical protein